MVNFAMPLVFEPRSVEPSQTASTSSWSIFALHKQADNGLHQTPGYSSKIAARQPQHRVWSTALGVPARSPSVSSGDSGSSSPRTTSSEGGASSSRSAKRSHTSVPVREEAADPEEKPAVPRLEFKIPPKKPEQQQ
eukprot:TRINITY_DN17004_c0_g1_i2.p1 TRINITY_DN17004_c0_g1~~TRINITY_DN17004_c0_g1_i2.p1  ORF type:complete len:136 (-),score=19.79 TRINITY_DN17004_c0_g1_i2:146-553(-)